ncbi:hypothetical protein GOODEAATRI_020149, partial [Goodea atripinnis]
GVGGNLVAIQASRMSTYLHYWSVVILLYSAALMVCWLWRRSLDPDNYSILYLTALGDLLGTGFLALTFRFLVMASSNGTGL